MGYSFYLDQMLLPVTPGKIQFHSGTRSKTISLVSDGEVNVLRAPGLCDISFEMLLPQAPYPFAVYEGGYRGADFFTRRLEKLQRGKKPFRFIITRAAPDGRLLFDTNLRVSLEEYMVTEDAEVGGDLVVTVKLREYRSYGTKTVAVKNSQAKTRSSSTSVSMEPPPAAATHTVVKGDCLYNIAQTRLGSGKRYPEIYALNKALIDGKNAGTGNPKYTIYPGQVLTLPEV